MYVKSEYIEHEYEYEYEYLKNVLEYTSTEYFGPRSAFHMFAGVDN